MHPALPDDPEAARWAVAFPADAYAETAVALRRERAQHAITRAIRATLERHIPPHVLRLIRFGCR